MLDSSSVTNVGRYLRIAPTRPPSGTLDGDALLDAVRSSLHGGSGLDGLDPATYARDHAAFEARSDQRSMIVEHLSARARRLTDRDPVSVLSVGCGDGSVDAEVARRLGEDRPGRRVRYVGIEPFAGSAAGFLDRMARIASPTLETEVHVATFEEAGRRGDLGGGQAGGGFDVVTFVHSMYYVPDVADTVLAAHALLRPGGELIVVSAPRGALNRLAGVLAPPVEGHRQWFSDDVAAGFRGAGLVLERTDSLEARLDLTGADHDVLDFTVQARLTPAVRAAVLDYLADVRLPVPGRLLVPHPVDIHRLTRTARSDRAVEALRAGRARRVPPLTG